jgi:hypothetical protein
MFASVSGRCICLQWFLNVFQAFLQLCLDVCFKCFICLLFVCCTVASRCFKNKSGVAHGMHVGSGRRCGDFWGGVGDVRGYVGPLLVRSLVSPTRYTLVCPSTWQRPNASVLDGRPRASKSVNFIFSIQSRRVEWGWNLSITLMSVQQKVFP